MLYITKLTPVSGGIMKLEIGKSRFFLEPAFCIKSGFSAGCEISSEQLEQIQYEAQRTKIKQRAAYYVSLRPYSKVELERKLKQKFREHELIREAIQRLDELNLLDDKAVTEFVTELLIRKRQGVNRIKAKLQEKGISRGLIDESVERTNTELKDDYRESLKTEFLKKLTILKKRGTEDAELKTKLIRYLLSRGYLYPEIRECINDNLSEFGNDAESISEDF